MTELDQMVQTGKQNLARLHNTATQLGFGVSPMDWVMTGVGFGVSVAPHRQLAVACEFGEWNTVYFSAGLAKEVLDTGLDLLLTANYLTRGNSAFPVFVHHGGMPPEILALNQAVGNAEPTTPPAVDVLTQANMRLSLSNSIQTYSRASCPVCRDGLIK